MGLKCLLSNEEKIFWYSRVATVLEEGSKSPQNNISSAKNTQQKSQIRLNSAKTQKNDDFWQIWKICYIFDKFVRKNGMPTNEIAQGWPFESPAEHLRNRVQIIGNSTEFQRKCRELGLELQKSYPFAWEVFWKSAKSIWLGEVWTHAVSVALTTRQAARIAKNSKKNLGDIFHHFVPKECFAQNFRFQLILSVFWNHQST